MIYDDASGAPMYCCDLVPQGPLDTDWHAKLTEDPSAKACDESNASDAHGHGAHGAAPAAAAAAAAPAKAAPAGAAPAGHAGHAGHGAR